MALIDSEASEIVIRLVYDGPPEAGKTTSLRALASSLTRTTFSPEEDADGRTLWFDWMEYVGGRFEGSQIRCQIVSVAGQRELAARRHRVIADADVVVFVADSAASETPRTLAYLQELRAMLNGGLGSPAGLGFGSGGGAGLGAGAGADASVPVGVILQANKRDRPDAIPLGELRAKLADIGWPIGVVESIASEGTGIREAFVYAVRLALDRVREQLQRGPLPATSGPRTADELLAVLRDEDRELHAPAVELDGESDSLAAELFREVLAFEEEHTKPEPRAVAAQPAAQATVDDDAWDELPTPLPAPALEAHEIDASDILDAGEITPATAEADAQPLEPPPLPALPALSELRTPTRPRPPNINVPSGAVWPPVEGRAILQDLATIELSPRKLSNGDWAAGLGSGWRVMSNRDAVFATLDQGRNALIQWARLHSIAAPALSHQRCIVVADDGTGSWRLWQLVRAEPSLRDAVEQALGEPERDALLAGLRQVAKHLIEAETQLAPLPVRLPCTLDNLGPADAGVAYIGLMPDSAAPTVAPRARRDSLTVLRTSLEPIIAHELREHSLDLADILGRLENAEGIPQALPSLLGA